MYAPSVALEGGKDLFKSSMVNVLRLRIVSYNVFSFFLATGFPTWATIIICGFVATIYTSIVSTCVYVLLGSSIKWCLSPRDNSIWSCFQGGMKAVVWTDAMQGIIYVGGVLLVNSIESTCLVVN